MDKRGTVRLPAEYAQEMKETSKRTGLPIAHLVRCGWQAVREHFLRLPTPTTVDVDAIYKTNKRKN
jgi:hypothetical protein